MSNIDQGWAATTADSSYEDDVTPPPGWMGIAQVASTRAGVSGKGETYFVIDLVADEYHWAIYKQLTTNGVYQDGKGKSAKITLRQLGIDQNTPWPLVDATLKTKVGQWFAVEQKASTTINKTTGFPYVNTEITGVASAPAQPVAQAAQHAVVQAQANQIAGGPATFPPAVPGTPATVVAPVAAPVQAPAQDPIPY